MIYLVLLVLSVVLTYGVKHFAYQKSIMDVPNERSSHTVPTPRGGGIAILIVFYIGLFYFKEAIDPKLFYALFCAIPVAIIGLMDDILTLSSKIRFLVQGVSALGALFLLGGVDTIDFVFFELQGGWLNVIALISILWLSNLYNFLDGIDGYAGTQTATVGLGMFLLFHHPLGLVFVFASLGFLFFNWKSASIFMGDVGSTTLGFIFGIIIFHDMGDGNIYMWLVLLSVFWVDATLTLVRRYLNGEHITQAHKKHAYQRLTQSGWAHDKVVWSSLGFNLIFIVLLYFIEDAWIVFFLNIIALIVIIKFIDDKKSFI